jgi:hypothetical protein
MKSASTVSTLPGCAVAAGASSAVCGDVSGGMTSRVFRYSRLVTAAGEVGSSAARSRDRGHQLPSRWPERGAAGLTRNRTSVSGSRERRGLVISPDAMPVLRSPDGDRPAWNFVEDDA